METKHTPGPWSINAWPQAGTDIAIGAIGTPLIAKVPLRDVSIIGQQANADLIAAAPELLEACQLMLTCMGLAGWENDLAAIKARTAIAKAAGGAA